MDVKKLLKFLGSLRLTLVLLCAAMLVVLVGTLAQVDIGIYAAQAKYFRSFFVYAEGPGGFKIPVMPGGYLVGAGMVINLLVAGWQRFQLKWAHAGSLLVHGGLLLLLLGQLVTDLRQVESSMRLKEGESRNYSESGRRFELAITDRSDPKFDRVTVIPDSLLAVRKTFRLPELPFTLRVLAAWPNSKNVSTNVDNHVPPATRGQGLRLKFAAAPPVTRSDRRNLPSAYVELLADGQSLGVWLVSAWLAAPEAFTYQGRRYTLSLRARRYYKPFYLTLLDFTHENYPGTDIPKSFSSRVRIHRPDTGEDREVLIYMNHPLRYEGETFYQSGYDPRDPTVTILQVVRNPGWLIPYISSTLISLGLLFQFLKHLGGFLRRKKTAK
jgi:hypothetical protein